MLPMRPFLFSLVFLAACGKDSETSHSLVDAALRLRSARERGDTESVRALLAADSRIWFEERTGPGSQVDPEGRGPWAEWDRFFRSRSRVLESSVQSDTAVVLLAEEINDFYRLLDRPPKRVRITYSFDASGRIAGTLVQSVDDGRGGPGRMPEFEAWARTNHPDVLKRILPAGEVDPSHPGAWRDLLVAWRAESGLPLLD